MLMKIVRKIFRRAQCADSRPDGLEILSLKIIDAGDGQLLSMIDFEDGSGVADGNEMLACAIATARLSLRAFTGHIDDQAYGDGSFGMAVQKVVNKGLMEPRDKERCIYPDTGGIGP